MQVALAPADEDALYALFAAVRAEELAMDGWDPALRALVLRQQFDARQRGYRAQYPAAHEYLITADGAAVGWATLERTAPAWRLVDIAVTREWRRHGVATRVIRAWQEDARASGAAITLNVLTGNAGARALYDRLDFRVVSEDDTHLQMEWRA